MGKYINISKDFFDKTLDKGCETYEQQLKLIQNLKGIKTFINLTEEDIELLEKANDLLMEKLEKLEDIIDDKENIFYNSSNEE